MREKEREQMCIHVREQKKSFTVSRTYCKGIGRRYSSDRMFACVR